LTGRRVAFHTFGCKLNQYETEALASSFRSHGFLVVDASEEADVHVINTCTVTSRADHKARSLVRAVAHRRPEEPVIVTGCSAQTESSALASLAANVVVVPQSEKARLLEIPAVLVRAGEAGESRVAALLAALAAAGGPSDPFALVVGDYSFHTRAFLKIQDGCDCRCAYCRVPLARGASVSLGTREVLRRAEELEASGRREIVLTGVNVSAWRSEGLGLPQLLLRLLDATRRVRFRLTSIEPEAITRELAECVGHPRVCPHFHIPVQSGSDAVLLRMKRRYRADRVMDGVRLLRAARQDPFIAADIIVGFPGESDEDHSRTLVLIRELAFAALHVFPFSPRPGTPAAAMQPTVPERIRRDRAREVAALGTELAAAYARRWVGREVAVLLEAGRAGHRTRGVSENYLRVDVRGVPGEEAAPGRLVRAVITDAGPTMRANFRTFEP
jgi:threonylcarbamoyladenosine tRNA methylthiotransferase MtaB